MPQPKSLKTNCKFLNKPAPLASDACAQSNPDESISKPLTSFSVLPWLWWGPIASDLTLLGVSDSVFNPSNRNPQLTLASIVYPCLRDEVQRESRFENLINSTAKQDLPGIQWLRLCFHCRSCGFHPWLGHLYDPTCCLARKKNPTKFATKCELKEFIN